MWRAVLANVRANGLRLVLTFTTVLIGATFVSSSVIFAESLARGHAGLPAGLAVLVARDADQEAGAALDEEIRARLGRLPGVAGAAGVVEGYAAAVGRDGKVVLPRGFDIRMTGTNWTGRLRLEAGHAPTGPDEVALASQVAEAGDIRLGDRIDVLHPTGSARVTVTGRYSYTATGRESGAAPGVAFDTVTAQRLLLAPGRYTAVELTAEAGADPHRIAEAAGGVLPAGFTAFDRDSLTRDLRREARSLTASIQGTALTFAVISLLVGSSLIMNTFAMLVTRRSRELALMRAVGATRRQIRRWVLAEAAVIGIAGSVVGFVVGAALAYPVTAYASSFDSMLSGDVVVGWPALVSALAAGTLVTVVSAWLPARRAARIPPAAALHTSPIEAARDPRWRRRVGKVLAVPTGLAIVIGAAGTGDGFGLLGMLGALLSLPTVLLLVPTIGRRLVRLLSRPMRRRVSLALAVQNVARSPRRTAATASAVLVGVALTTGIGIFAASITAQAITDMTGVLDDDIVVENVSGGPVNPQSVARVAAVPGVETVTLLHEVTVNVNGEPTRVSVVDPAALGVTLHLDLAGARPDDLASGAFVVRETAVDRGWSTGDELTLPGDDDRRTVRITAVLPDAPLLGDIILGAGQAQTVLPGTEQGNPLLVAVSDEADHSDVRRAVESAVADRPDLRVVSPTTYVRGLITEVDAFLGVAGGLLGLSLLIAFLGIINTLAISVTERLREVGLLRVVGMSRGQIGTMVCAESLILAAIGGLLGLLTGFVLGAMAQHLVLTRPVTALTVPLPTVTACLVGLIAGALLAAAWPARHAARANLLEAVTPE